MSILCHISVSDHHRRLSSSTSSDSPSIDLKFQSNLLKKSHAIDKILHQLYNMIQSISNQKHSTTILYKHFARISYLSNLSTRKNDKKTWLSKPTKAPLICGIASRSWSASKAFAQDRQHQEGLKVGTDLAVFSKDLHLEVSKVWGEEPWEVVTFMFRPPYQPISLPPESFPNVSPMGTPCLSLLWKLRS